MSTNEHPETIAPTTEDAALARDSSRALSRFASRFEAGGAARGGLQQVRLQIHADGDRPDGEAVSIPASAFRVLMDALNQMAQGNAVTLIPTQAELTTQQAADVLNVSRPFVIKLIEDEQLPCKMVGTHRRVLFNDLMDYKRKVDADRLKVLDDLAAQSQELGMGY